MFDLTHHVLGAGLTKAEDSNDLVVEETERKRARQEFGDADGTAPAVQQEIMTNGSNGVHEKDEEEMVKVGDKEGGEAGEKPRRYKKRKVAIFVAYSGVGYQGMQRNPGAITIEGELEEALFRAGAIAQSNFGDPKKIDWMRAARTDKGVSAVGQVVSAKLFIDPPGLVERVNSYLPKQVRMFGYKRVIHTFSAKNLCDRRRYEYCLPVFAFDPNAHQYKGSSEAGPPALSTGVKNLCNGESVGNDGVHIDRATVDVVTANASVEVGQDERSQAFVISTHEEVREAGSMDTCIVKDVCQETVGEKPSPASTGVPQGPASQSSPFRFDEKVRQRLNGILRKYEGTHNFHNFTTRIKAQDPSARRYMVSFEAQDVLELEGKEFVRCVVVGQSFMLHQIRKMIGMAVAIMRGCIPETVLEPVLRP